MSGWADGRWPPVYDSLAKNAATWQHTVQHEPEVGHGIELESRELVEAEMGWIDFRQIRPESQVSINLCFVSTGRVAALQSRRDMESIAFFDASTLFNACPQLGAVSPAGFQVD